MVAKSTTDTGLGLAVIAALCAVGMQIWINAGVGEEISRLKNEEVSMAQAVGAKKNSVLALSTQRDVLEGSISDLSLARFSTKVRQQMERFEDLRFSSYKPEWGHLDQFYAALFARLRLTPAKLNSLRDLLAIRVHAEREAMGLALADDVVLDEAPDRLAILSAGTQDVDDSIKQLLGDEAFAVFETYQGTIQTRKFVLQPLAERLQFGAEPLSNDQLDQLAASVPPYYFGIQQYIMSGPAPELPESLDAAAERVLTAGQLQAYKQYKNVWESQTAKARLDQELAAQNIRANANASTH